MGGFAFSAERKSRLRKEQPNEGALKYTLFNLFTLTGPHPKNLAPVFDRSMIGGSIQCSQVSAVSLAVERPLHTRKVTGSNPVPRTSLDLW
jgi:hypothetical protein